MSFVEQICTRAIWMEKGQIRYDGTPEEAVAKYREAQGVKPVKNVRNNRNTKVMKNRAAQRNRKNKPAEKKSGADA
jgi:teichoic acid transport system ATP-binding protein